MYILSLHDALPILGVATFGQAAAIDQQLGFSRQAEQEADRIGFQMLTQAGYDPKGMAQMFQRLMQSTRLNQPPKGSYASTHPLRSEERRVGRRGRPRWWAEREKHNHC